MGLSSTTAPSTQVFRARIARAVATCALILTLPLAVASAVEGRAPLVVVAIAVQMSLAVLALRAHRGMVVSNPAAASLALPLLALASMSIAAEGFAGIIWCFPIVVVSFLVLPTPHAAATTAVLILITVKDMVEVAGAGLTAQIVMALGATAACVALAMNVIGAQHRTLRRLATTDPLTGLRNRSELAPLTTAAVSGIREGRPSSLLVLDVDHFQRINEAHGHRVGDDVLRALARSLRDQVRDDDVIIRLDGEELAVGMLDTALPDARRRAEAIRAVVEADLAYAVAARSEVELASVTVSVGVAAAEMDDDSASWLHRADAALRTAKRAGRNRVVVG
ncbi:MAG: GGDEF domain-containing protein [Actinomycetota bacterium]